MSFHTHGRDAGWFRADVARPRAKLRLFCFPHAGGTSALYRGWGDALGPLVEVLAVVLPGREERHAETLSPSFGPLIDDIAEAITQANDRPFAFFGHSMGGLVAFEVARALRRAGAALPDQLFLSASRPPHLWHEFEPLHLLPEDQFRRALARMGGTPAPLLADDDFMSILSPMLRRDFKFVADYRHIAEPPLLSHMSVFGAVDDTVMPFRCLHEWQRHTARRFSLQTFTGGHFYLSRARAVVLEVLTRKLVPVEELKVA